MEIYDKSASIVTSAVFNTRQHVASTREVQNKNILAF